MSDGYDYDALVNGNAIDQQQLNSNVLELKVALLNEKLCPEILQYKDELVDDIKKQLELQQDLIIQGGGPNNFSIAIYQMEIDRIRFMLTSYLRVRLLKLEKYVFYIMATADFHNRLSPGEFEYAKQHLNNIGSHFNDLVLNHLPDKFKGLDETKTQLAKPPLNEFVFCRVKKDIGDVDVGDLDLAGGHVDLEKDDAYLLRYIAIQTQLYEGKVDLI